MPTENRSTMVSVPRELLECLDLGKNTATALSALPELRALLAQPAQHQGEPFAWFDSKNSHFITADGRATALSMGHGDRLERYSVPLYTRPATADPGEVERLIAQCVEKDALIAEMDRIGSAKLAERDALLRLARQFVVNGVDLGYIQMPDADTPDPAHDLVPKIDAALFASAEPVDPNKPCNHDYRLGECTKCGCISATE